MLTLSFERQPQINITAIMNFKLIVNPTKKEHYPDRYRAVLLLDGGLCKMYPHDMQFDAIMASVAGLTNELEIEYNQV